MNDLRGDPNEKTRLLSKTNNGKSDGTRPHRPGSETAKTKYAVTAEAPREDGAHDLIPLQQEIWELSSMAVQFSLREMVRQTMSITDTAFLGHIGTKQLAGASLAIMWMGVPSGFIQSAIQAISTLCSQANGAGNDKLVGVWLQLAVVFAVIGAVPVVIFYLNVSNLIALTMDDEETVQYGSEFAKMMALGLVPQYIYGACATYFATQGVIIPATVCSAFTLVVNIFFNKLFIYGALGWDGFGFIGSPLATVTSACLQLVLFLLYTVWWKRYHKKYWGGWSRECLDTERVKVFLKLAIPMGLSSVVNWGSAATVGAFSGYLGPNIAASQAVNYDVFALIISAVMGFMISTQIRLSRYLGKGSAVAARRVLTVGSVVVFSGAVVMLLLLIILRDRIFKVWTNDPVIVDMCTSVLHVLVTCIAIVFARSLLTWTVNALALAHINLWAELVGSWCVYVPLSYLLPISWDWGLDGFWWADIMGETFKVVVLVWGISRVDWQVAADNARRTAEATGKLEEEDDGEALQELQKLMAYDSNALVSSKMDQSAFAEARSLLE